MNMTFPWASPRRSSNFSNTWIAINSEPRVATIVPKRNIDRFSRGTRDLAHAIANTKAFTIAGGGDTLAAIAAFGVADSISYVSTGGGAFLEFLEGKKLPAVQILEERSMA